MALASVAAENAALNGLDGTGTVNTIPYTSLHTATTGITGASEYAGVTRQACTWNAAASGAKTNASSLSFTTSGASAVTHMGTWSASTAGTFGIGLSLASSVSAVTITFAPGSCSLGAT